MNLYVFTAFIGTISITLSIQIVDIFDRYVKQKQKKNTAFIHLPKLVTMENHAL